jgi:1-acyl-sn-glycerol-3-phosphate acyltransferase
MLRSLLVYIFVGSYILFVAPFAILWSLLAKETRTIYRLARFCIRIGGFIGGVRVKITGREKIETGQNYLFLSNHQGNLDAPVLAHALPRDVRALVKKEVMNIPMLSLVMKTVRMVPIDRKDPAMARNSIDLGAQMLKEGYSFIAFPEGTRSRDGRLGEFKKGVFVMALKSGIPVMPITIQNSGRIQPPGAFAIRPGVVEVIFHDPIPTGNLAIDDREQLAQMTRAAIADELQGSAPDRTPWQL